MNTAADTHLNERSPVPTPAAGRQTRTTQLLAQIRNEIISGRLQPQERLVLSTLCEQFGAGQTPVREALLRLASEGMVVQEDQRGFSVAPVSRAELLDLTVSRAEVDAMTLRWSIERGDDEWEAQLLGAFHRLQKARKILPDSHSIDPDWLVRHTAFHNALVAACPNQVMLQLRTMLYDRSDRYRHLSVRYLRVPRDDVAEHEALLNAALARDIPLAEALIKAHISHTTKVLLNEMDQAGAN